MVPKARTGKFRLTVNMRIVNRHPGEKAFKFEGLKDLAEREDYAVSYDLVSGYYHVGLFQASRTYVGFKWAGKYYVYNCLPLGSRRPIGSFQRWCVNWSCIGGGGASGCSPTWTILGSWSEDFDSVSGWRAGWRRTSFWLASRSMCRSVIQERRQLGFDVDFAVGEFRVPDDRWAGRYPHTREEWWPAYWRASRGRVVNVPLLGSGDPALHEAYVCPDKFRVDTKLLGGVDGGSD